MTAIPTPAASVLTRPVSFFGSGSIEHTTRPEEQPRHGYYLWDHPWDYIGRVEMYTKATELNDLEKIQVITRVATTLLTNSKPLDKAIADAISDEFWNLF